MLTNILLNVIDEKHVSIDRGEVAVGVAYFTPDRKVAVYGFEKMAGPWGCGRFPEYDAVLHFPHDPDVIERYDPDLGRHVTMDFGGDPAVGYRFRARSPTQVDIMNGDKRVGDIWSELGNKQESPVQRAGILQRINYFLGKLTNYYGSLPYPSNSGCADSIQVCGFVDRKLLPVQLAQC